MFFLSFLQVAKLLVEAGANQGIKNKEEKVPVEMAKPEVNMNSIFVYACCICSVLFYDVRFESFYCTNRLPRRSGSS